MMNGTGIIKQREIKNKPVINGLLVAAIIFRMLDMVCDFFTYDAVFEIGYPIEYKLVTRVPGLIEWFYVAWDLAPILLLLAYINLGFKNKKLTVLVLLAFVFKAVRYFNALISDILMLTEAIHPETDLIVIFINAVFGVTWILAFVVALTGLRKRIFLYVAVIPELFLCIVLGLPAAAELFGEFVLYAIDTISFALVRTFFGVAVFLFAQKNIIPATIKKYSNIRFECKMKPEKALEYLNDIYAFGEITEQEYVARRAEVLNRI